MNILCVLVQFVSLCSLWAGLCSAVYGALRVFGRRFPLALSCLGTIGLLCWCALFCALAFFAGVSWDDVSAVPYPYLFVGSVGAILLATLSVGGCLIRQAAQKSWWQGILFCALYITVAHPICGLGLGITGLAARLGDSWMNFVHVVGIRSTDSLFILWISMWLFPLGVPIAEIGVRSFWRAFKIHQQGYAV